MADTMPNHPVDGHISIVAPNPQHPSIGDQQKKGRFSSIQDIESWTLKRRNSRKKGIHPKGGAEIGEGVVSLVFPVRKPGGIIRCFLYTHSSPLCKDQQSKIKTTLE